MGIESYIKRIISDPKALSAFASAIRDADIIKAHDHFITKRSAISAITEKGQASNRYKLGEVWELNGEEIQDAILSIPPVRVRKISEASWLYDEDNNDFYCSACCALPIAGDLTPYCPYCGSFMGGNKNNEK